MGKAIALTGKVFSLNCHPRDFTSINDGTRCGHYGPDEGYEVGDMIEFQETDPLRGDQLTGKIVKCVVSDVARIVGDRNENHVLFSFLLAEVNRITVPIDKPYYLAVFSGPFSAHFQEELSPNPPVTSAMELSIAMYLDEKGRHAYRRQMQAQDNADMARRRAMQEMAAGASRH